MYIHCSVIYWFDFCSGKSIHGWASLVMWAVSPSGAMGPTKYAAILDGARGFHQAHSSRIKTEYQGPDNQFFQKREECGVHEREWPGRFDIEDTRATRRSRYWRTSKLRNFEVGTFLSTIIGAVAVVSYLCFMWDIAGYFFKGNGKSYWRKCLVKNMTLTLRVAMWIY